MKKIISWLGISLLALSTELPAQAIFQSYYQWINILNVDHGPYKKVRTWQNGSTPIYFAVGGATDPSTNGDMATFSSIDGSTGAMLFTKIITQPFPTTQTFEATGVAVADNFSTALVAVLCNHTDNTGLTQALLYEFDVSGTLVGAVNLGAGTGVDVVYNSSASAFDVLCEVNGTNGTDFELTGVNAFGFFPLWTTTYNWGAQDKPAALVIDNGEIVADGYTTVGTDRQILMVRTTAFGQLVWGQAFGLANRSETITDVVFYVNQEGQFRYGFCGWDDLTDQGLIGDVAISGPQDGYSERYITSINTQQKQIHINAIARSDNNIFACGMYNKRSPFIATFIKNANLRPLSLHLFDDQESAPEELLDIQANLGQTNVVSVGYQQRSVAWNSSPANQRYSWIMTTTTSGVSTCQTAAIEGSTLLSGSNPQQFVSTGNGTTVGNFTGFSNPTFFTSLDNCITPSRLAAPGSTTAEPERFSSLYPNPGSGIFYLDGAIAEDEKALLRITDLSGRVVDEYQLVAGTTQQTIDLTGLANGIYSWSIILNDNPVRSEKLIIAR
jgi:hypothetical protein